jgi:hypothetical protein
MDQRTAWRTGRRGAAIVVAAGTLAACGTGATGAAPSSSAGRSPTVFTAWQAPATFSLPPDSGQIVEPLSGNPTGMAAHGYVEQEYFASGTAYAFAAAATPSDGRWRFTVTTSAPYTTRLLVRRPSDPAKFDGNVVVEWMNVSAGESAPDWDYLNPALMDAGAAYVGVSVQALGVNGGTALLGNKSSGSSPGLRGLQPTRYAQLHHPGDRYALDIYAQIGRALRAPAPSALGGLRPVHVLAVGESQSAFYLTTYADAIQTVDHAYQGIFIHSRGGGAVPLDGGTVTSAISAAPVRIRTDLHVPVFMFETQTDLIQLMYAGAQQPDTAGIHTWEVAGTSHADAYELGPAAGLLGCTTAVNNGPQHQVAQAAAVAFLAWVDHGTPPPTPLPFALGSHPVQLTLDAHGNVVGGVRTPAVDVPVSTLSGAAPANSSVICGLFGSSVPFSQQTLVALYGMRGAYVAAYAKDLDRAIAAGYILPTDRAGLLAQAGQVPFPS